MKLNRNHKRNLIWLLLLAVLLTVFQVLRPVLAPFIIAAVLAYALAPLVNALEKLGRGHLPRSVAVVVVEILLILLSTGLVLLVVPIVSKEIPLLRQQVPLLFEHFNTYILPSLHKWGVSVPMDMAGIKALLLDYLNTNAEETAASVLSSLKLGGSMALTIVGNAVLIPVVLFYLLMDWDSLVVRFLEFIPLRLRSGYDSFMQEADAVLGQYLRGQILVMLALAVFYSAGLLSFGLDLALPIGIFTGLAVFVPYLGFGLGLILALLAGLLQFASIKAVIMVAVVFGAGQFIESFLLTPRLVGERIGLHPLAVIFALMAFGQIMGFLGILIALPASAVLLVGMRRLKKQYLESTIYQG